MQAKANQKIILYKYTLEQNSTFDFSLIKHDL